MNALLGSKKMVEPDPNEPTKTLINDNPTNATKEKSGGGWKIILFCIFAPIVLIIAVYSLMMFLTHDSNPDAIKIDTCLDQGGAWDYDKRICNK